MHRPKRWNIAEPSAAAQELAERLKTSALIAQILWNRGVRDMADSQKFLYPSLKHLHDPADIANLPQAAERIARAIRQNEKIVIYGDYDVDGITGTAILWHAIRLLGGQAEYYIPHRLEEGYGMNPEAVNQIIDGGAKLIVSVDCGITAIEEAQIARQRGVDLIVTDHHDWREDGGEQPADGHQQAKPGRPVLPDCCAIVHPRLPREGSPCVYLNPYLCGAGVAFKLAWGIGTACSGAVRVNEEFRNFLVEATALAALGTIADVVPLVGENRTLAYFGLGGLKHSRLRGVQALIASAGLTGQNLDSYHVGFLLAPRLNACGRMGHARLAVEMLTDADEQKAGEIAAYLEQQNRARQALERKILDEALQQVATLGLDNEDCRAIVLGAEGWHPGVIGIVASRIVSRYNRPTIMVALSEGHGQGSGRSIAGFHLARALAACGNHLEGFGGHEMAAGLRIASSKFEAFREAFCRHARDVLDERLLLPQLHLDCVAEIRQINEAMVRDLERLGPFGVGNRKPLLCCEGAEVAAAPRRVGRSGEHLQLLVRQGGSTMKCIAFNHGSLFEHLQPGVKIDLAVEPCVNEFNGRRTVELEVKDVRFPR